MAPPGRILIAHPDPLARAYMRGLAESHGGTLEADRFETLLAQLREEPGIELAIVDLDLPGMSLETGLRYVAAHHPGLWVAMLCSVQNPNKLDTAPTNELLRWIPKFSEGALMEKLGRMLAGADHVSHSAPSSPLSDHRAEFQPAFFDHELTTRQRDVLRLLCQGHSNREIAQMLGIAEGTVKVHVNGAFRALGVRNRVSAAAICREYFDTV